MLPSTEESGWKIKEVKKTLPLEIRFAHLQALPSSPIDLSERISVS